MVVFIEFLSHSHHNPITLTVIKQLNLAKFNKIQQKKKAANSLN